MIAAGAVGVVLAGAAARWWNKNRNKIADKIEDTLEDAIEDLTGEDVELGEIVDEVMESADEVVAETVEAVESGEDVVESVKESVAEEVAELKEDLSALTVAQLKLRLKEAGLPVSGTKLTLINRLSEMEE